MIAYRIDRHGTMSVGKTLELCKDFTPDDAYPDLLMNDFLSGGISDSGKTYLIDAFTKLPYNFSISDWENAHSFVSDFLTEYTFELIRQARYPNLPSRYQAIYAVKDISDFADWPELTQQAYPIYKIEFDEKDSVYLDAEFLKICLYREVNENMTEINYGFSPGNSWYLANQYWSGAISASPKMELLIKAPVKVIERCS